ncbi:MAG: hypothetical protein ACFNUC_03690 [Selenomonas noxia]
MTHCEKLYNFFIEHPKASADEVMEALNWERRQVSRYKHRLKRRGFNPIHDYKQDAYRQAADACLDRIHDPETTIPQMIELIRELRMILKAIIPA